MSTIMCTAEPRMSRTFNNVFEPELATNFTSDHYPLVLQGSGVGRGVMIAADSFARFGPAETGATSSEMSGSAAL